MYIDIHQVLKSRNFETCEHRAFAGKPIADVVAG